MTFLAAASQRPWGDVCHIKDRWGQLFQVCFFGLLLSETSIQDKQVEGERGSTWERKQPLAPLEKRSVGSFPSTSVLWKLSMPSFSCHSTVAFRGWVHPPPSLPFSELEVKCWKPDYKCPISLVSSIQLFLITTKFYRGATFTPRNDNRSQWPEFCHGFCTV